MNEETEKKLRDFLVNNLMMEQAEFFKIEDELDLDSLDQTELRVFLTEDFGINTDFDKVPPEALATLQKIGQLIEPAIA